MNEIDDPIRLAFENTLKGVCLYQENLPEEPGNNLVIHDGEYKTI